MTRLNVFNNPWLALQKHNEIIDELERRVSPGFLGQYSPFSALQDKEYDSPSELYRLDDKFILLVPAPGFTKDEIEIDASKNHISITCTRREKNNNNSNFKLIRGTTLSSLSYREPIPGIINPDSIDASLDNGILRIELSIAPKKEIASKIKIK